MLRSTSDLSKRRPLIEFWRSVVFSSDCLMMVPVDWRAAPEAMINNVPTPPAMISSLIPAKPFRWGMIRCLMRRFLRVITHHLLALFSMGLIDVFELGS